MLPKAIALVLLMFATIPAHALELGVGPLFMWHFVDFEDLNGYVSTLGVDEFGNGLFLFGGYGYLSPTDNFRIGVVRAGYSKTSTKTVGNVIREVSYSMSYGGVTLEYIKPIGIMNNVSLGVLLGGGGVKVRIEETGQEDVDWGDVWKNYTDPDVMNHTAILNSTYFAWQPFIRFKYHIHPLIALQGSIGYLAVKPSSWKLGENADVHNAPDLDFSGIHITFGPHLGL